MFITRVTQSGAGAEQKSKQTLNLVSETWFLNLVSPDCTPSTNFLHS